jgi:hypothetical protein
MPDRERRRERRRRLREEWREERRKDRVLHTRISDRLAEDIRRIAEELRVPVSNLVRNVLEETFGVVEAVTNNVGDLLEDLLDEAEVARQRFGERGRAREARGSEGDLHAAEDEAALQTPSISRSEFPEVLGWQALILNASRSCADCGAARERGERAFLGLSASGSPGPVLCPDCMHAREAARPL